MLDQTASIIAGRDRLAHAGRDHPPVPRQRVGVLLANLGTPDGTDYWSMRRYLDEFLSDRRVIEWTPWLWQPILKLMVLSRRPFKSGENYRGIWNEELDESPLLTVTRAQTDLVRGRLAAAVRRRRDGRFLHALRQSLDRQRDPPHGPGGLRADRVLSALSPVFRGDDGDGQRPRLPHPAAAPLAAGDPDRPALLRPPGPYRGSGPFGRGRLGRIRAGTERAGRLVPRPFPRATS